jgi:3-vinyl bacteriochlorophyllide hydratase
MSGQDTIKGGHHPLYTPEQKVLRDNSVWTLIQGILAPIQFAVFLFSLYLVLQYMFTGTGYEEASRSVVLKTGFLLLIMVTGAIWEKVIFGQFLFAPAFFWEDVFSFAVIALHLLYVYGLSYTNMAPMPLMFIALAAYAAYVVNAGQFIWKLRMARLQAAANEAANIHTGALA